MSAQRIPLLLLLVSLLLVGCTGKTSYRFLDWVVAWAVDDYVSWTPPQREQFDIALERHLQWHQRTQLPRYSALLQQLKQDVQQPLTEPLLRQRLEQLNVFWTDVMLQIAPDVALLLAQLNDDQVADLLTNMQEITDEAEEEYRDLTREDMAEKRIKAVQKAAQRFIGRLSAEQKAQVVLWEQNLGDTRPEWLKSRALWAVAFNEVLQKRRNENFASAIIPLYVEPQAMWSEQYRTISENNTRNGINLVIALQSTFSDKQRKKLVDEIDYWITALDELAAEANASAAPVL